METSKDFSKYKAFLSGYNNKRDFIKAIFLIEPHGG